MGGSKGLLLLISTTAVLLGLVVAAGHQKKHGHHHALDPKHLPAFIGHRPTFPPRKSLVSTVDATANVVSSNFSQVKDHSADSDGKTFNHRFFKNSAYANGSQIHFLYLEGPYVADATKIGDESYPIVDLAKSVGATLWLLEHRFYGSSRPFVRLYNKNLPYLSSQQAVEDIASFIQAQNSASKEKNPKWVLFGSAYAGALALWFRSKYPDLTVGAVASSPLISLEQDNYQYELNLAESLIGNSYQCYRGVTLAARAIRQEMQYEKGIARLNTELHMSPGLNLSADDYKTFQFVHMELMPLLQYPVQYNKVNYGVFGHGGGIDDLCAIMSNETIRNIDKVYMWANIVFPDIYGSQDANGNWTIGSSYEAFLNAMWNARYANDGVELFASARAWLWQTCHEFGTWTTTDNGRNIFGTEVPNSYWIALCSDVFGGDIHQDNYDIDDLLRVLKNTSAAWDTTKTWTGTNTVITNGGHDPWRTLVPNVTTDASSVIYLADGVGHAADLQPPMDSDPFSLVQSRHTIVRNVKAWLSAASSSKMATSDIAIPRQATAPEMPQLKSLTSKVSMEHPNPEFLAYARRNTAPRGYKGRGYNGMNSRQHLLDRQLEREWSRSQKRHVDMLGNMTMDANMETWYIEQQIDHFDPKMTLTYQQRYLVNDRYVETQTPPIFLFLGGEAQIGWYYMAEDFFQWVQWAKDFHARMYVLEHRYYGDSQLFTNTSVPMLKWLRAEQVLADIAVFINTMNVKNNDSNPRWILFGGSYAGSLAAAMRVRYPDLTIGAIASSAPIQAQVDFWGYERWVQGMVNVYGDSECDEGIRKVMYEFQRKMSSKDGRKLMKEYGCFLNDWHEDNYVDEKDLQLFYAHYVEFMDVIVQYDDTDHYRVSYVCRMFEDCGFELGGDEMYAGSCSYLSEYTMYYVGRDEEDAEAKAAIDGIVQSAMKNASSTAEALAISKPLLKPIFERGYAERKKQLQARKMRLTKPDDDSPSYVDTHSTDVSTDYNDPSDDYTSNSCEGSNWSGSSGCVDEGDDLTEFECYCWYCDFVSYDRHVYWLEQTTLDDPSEFFSMDMRLWTYQTCTDWGYMMSTNYGRNIFEDLYPVNFLVDQCSDVFGPQFNRTSMENNVRHTNYLYGGQDNYNGTNIVFINGSEDPWHVLSIFGDHVPNNPDSVQVIYMTGTSHCKDMYLWRQGDKDVITQAQNKIKKQLSKWVNKSEDKPKKKKKKGKKGQGDGN